MKTKNLNYKELKIRLSEDNIVDRAISNWYSRMLDLKLPVTKIWKEAVIFYVYHKSKEIENEQL